MEKVRLKYQMVLHYKHPGGARVHSISTANYRGGSILTAGSIVRDKQAILCYNVHIPPGGI